MEIEGLGWMSNGQSVLSGALLDAQMRLDQMFLTWSKKVRADMYAFPTFLPVAELKKIDYFRSFPHLVNFVTNLKDEEDNLKSFTKGKVYHDDGSIFMSDASPIHDCLTPAACYHFYIGKQDSTLTKTFYGTTRSFCYRREKYYLPLQRQWCFNMREIVCVGDIETVRNFLKTYREMLEVFFKKLGLPIDWEIATDPFFDPSNNPKAIMQILDPVKSEMIFNKNLSIGSVNFHKNYFGQAFNINFENEMAFSGCIAFGLERWLFAFIETFGKDIGKWPKFEGMV